MDNSKQYQGSFAGMGFSRQPHCDNLMGVNDALHSDEVSNKGNPCIFESILCQEGYCSNCQIAIDAAESKSRRPIDL